MAVFLWLAWLYLGGKGWPRKTAATRRQYLRARPVSAAIYFWTFLTGVLAIISLAGLWIVLFQLIKMPPNVLPEYSRYPVLTVSAFILMGSLVSPLMEEAGFRGYLQVALERDFSVPVALLLSSLFFALAHLNHGLLAPKLLVYFLVGITFGALAWLTDSILPVIPVHIMGDVTFFILIWPHDKARPLFSTGGAGMWFWLHCAQAVVFATLSALAMRRLARTVPTQPDRNLAAKDTKIANRNVG
ncbi:MAG TPA: CPBP family intramembrane glutamic endopeptidase [Candidatus Binatia bacterium]|nr:CPBP family intramembrane glutamic endopeptidase [Candidatus Binatia bacterium]